MKALDFLTSNLAVGRRYLVYGEDDFLKELVVQKFIRDYEYEDMERVSVDLAEQAISFITEGSLFGIRLVLIDVKKWGRVSVAFLNALKESEDIIVLKAKTPTQKLMSYVEVECSPLKIKRQKKKFVTFLAEKFKLHFQDDVLEFLLERVEDLAELYSLVESLFYVFGLVDSVVEITIEEIAFVTAEAKPKKEFESVLLTGNIPRLSKEFRNGEPIYVLTVLFNILFKLYQFLEMQALGEEEEKVIEILKIPKWNIKDWRAAKLKYSSSLVRKLMIEVLAAYRQEMRGQSGQWYESLHFGFRRLLGE